MRVWTIFWAVVVAVLAVFAFANWGVLTAAATISLIFADVTAPLGLTLLGAMVGLTLLFLVFLVWLETKTLTGMGRARHLPQESVGAPIAELRADLERQFSGLRTESQESMRTVVDRLEALERVVKEGSERTPLAPAS
jgi:uncharacterized integral membrane protein